MKIHKRKYYYIIEDNKIDYSFVADEVRAARVNNKVSVPTDVPSDATKLMTINYEGDWYIFGLVSFEWYGYKINNSKAKDFLSMDLLSKTILFNDFNRLKYSEFENLKHTFRG